MPSRRLTRRRVVHKPTAGMLHSIPEAVGLVGNPPPDLTQNTVAGLAAQVVNKNICVDEQGGSAWHMDCAGPLFALRRNNSIGLAPESRKIR
jgi:hypothetical protein